MVILPYRTYFILYITVKLYRIQLWLRIPQQALYTPIIRMENYFGLINKEFSDVR